MEAPQTYQGWNDGERAQVLEDDDVNGLCAGDVGTIHFEVVGARQFHNERVIITIDVDGMDAGVEVQPDNLADVRDA